MYYGRYCANLYEIDFLFCCCVNISLTTSSETIDKSVHCIESKVELCENLSNLFKLLIKNRENLNDLSKIVFSV